ncbi:neutral cholesterol ester hydrolase 1-like [Scleropages formosus]|uniref:Neutral cholesterol ester hydrolase 1 n=1 Tax=Scleropages formosus TaxID=113540 RepID=A0A8C9SUJ4_SCLFO|nr:neutral cholesterol ester hydrolase 1-like [Scleropages formosus]
MKLLLSVTVLLAFLAAYFIYTPLPPTVSEPWKLMLLDATLRTIVKVNDVAHTLGLSNHVDVLNYAFGNLGAPETKSSEDVQVSDTAFAGVQVLVFQSTLKSEGKKRGVVYVHGGGWALGTTRRGFYNLLGRQMAKDLDAVIVSVEYRLVPNVRFPVPYEDVLLATKHFLQPEVLARYKVDPDRVGISGDSAGGNLAAAVAQQISIDDSVSVKFKVQALLYPVLQALDFNTPSYQQNQYMPILHRKVMVQFWLEYLGTNPSHLQAMLVNNHTALDVTQVEAVRAKVDWTALLPATLQKQHKPVVQVHGSSKILEELPALLDTRAAPLLAERDVLARLPQAYILTCEHDVLRDDGLMYGKRLQDAGVAVEQDHYEDGFHGCIFFTSWPMYSSVGLRALENYITWLQKNL